jgi:hypothetical protein
MPKASKARKKATKTGTVERRPGQVAVKSPAQPSARASGSAQVAASPTRVPATSPGNRAGQRGARLAAPGASGMQSVVFAGMVALGCWGMAFTLAYFYTDPNRYLFAGMAALMGLFWTYSLYMRIQKMRKSR